jgi:uncharacterized protein (TIGR02996 family)
VKPTDLIAAVQAAPDDDAPRAVYGDALSDAGDPLGELVAVQLELGRLDHKDFLRRAQLEDRERVLLRKHGKKWLKPYAKLATGVHFRRGLVERMTVSPQTLLERTDALFAAAPLLRGVELGADWDDAALTALARAKVLSRFRELRFFQPAVTVAGLSRLVSSPAVSALETLEIEHCLQAREGLATALSRSPHVAGLKSFRLRKTLLGSVGLRTLLVAETLPALRTLELHRSNIQDAGAVALARPHRLKLDRLEIGMYHFTPKSFKILMGAKLLGKLSYLALRDRYLAASSALALAASKQLKQLRVLDLDGATLDPEGARALAASKVLPKIERLRVCEYELDAGARAALEKRYGAALHLDPPEE